MRHARQAPGLLVDRAGADGRHVAGEGRTGSALDVFIAGAPGFGAVGSPGQAGRYVAQIDHLDQ